jgi:hypothetical protein
MRQDGAAWVAALVALAVALAPAPARATHENDHRFTVFGYVRDANGKAVPDAKVIVVDPRLDEGTTAFTDRGGYYEALLHLHNDDLGDEIIVTALEQRKTIRATFDPNDSGTVRRAQVDFGPAGATASGPDNWKWIAGGAVLVVAAVLAAMLRRRGAAATKGHVSPKKKKS